MATNWQTKLLSVVTDRLLLKWQIEKFENHLSFKLKILQVTQTQDGLSV